MSGLDDVREGVRRGIRDALEGELDRTSVRTVGRLVTAGALGLLAACAAVVLFSQSAMGDLGPLPLALCAAVWSGLLVVAFTIVLLQVGSRRLPLAEAALLALVGFALAAAMGAVCPHPQIMMRWVGALIAWVGQPAAPGAASALCVGLCTAALTGAGAAVTLGLRGVRFGVHSSAMLLFLLLWPAVFVQTLGTDAGTFVAWSVGIAAGTWTGVGAGALVSRVARATIRVSA